MAFMSRSYPMPTGVWGPTIQRGSLMIEFMINFMCGVYTTLNTMGTSGTRIPEDATQVVVRMVDGGEYYMFIYLTWYATRSVYDMDEDLYWDEHVSYTHKILIEKPRPRVLPLGQATILAHMGIEDLDY
jgi:hypothetical protein